MRSTNQVDVAGDEAPVDSDKVQRHLDALSQDISVDERAEVVAFVLENLSSAVESSLARDVAVKAAAFVRDADPGHDFPEVPVFLRQD